LWLQRRYDNNFFHPSLLLLFLDPGWVKIRIRDKHPGSATLMANLFFSHKSPVYFLRRMESYLNPVCGVQTEIAEPHGEPPTRGMDHSVHTLLIIKIIQDPKNIYDF
jgi:hypothetical protein